MEDLRQFEAFARRVVEFSHKVRASQNEREPRGVSIVRKLSNNGRGECLPRPCSGENPMSKVSALTSDNFAQAVENATGVVVVDFTAMWCPALQNARARLRPRVRKIPRQSRLLQSGQWTRTPKRRANTPCKPSPNILFFKDGQVVDSSVGYVAEGALSSKVDNILA